jgi:hypothetical protein
MERRSAQTDNPAGEDAAPLTISPEKVCFIIIKAREFDVKDEVTEPDPESERPRRRSRARRTDFADRFPFRR